VTEDATAKPDEIAPGTIVASRYRVVRKLGEGGMGSVHLVEHVHMRKTFALKLLHAEAMRSPDLVARFEREAVASGNIEHPNVAKATDFGKMPDGSYFLVLEYVEGQSLREVIAMGALVPLRALSIARKVLSGLGVAHDLGFVHRDIKPENILLVGAGKEIEPKILDFGLARVVEMSGQQLTRAGIVCGTPSYMAPEQALAQPVDLRADLYAVGVLLFEMISGNKPFTGDTLEILGKHVAAPPPALTSPHGEIMPETRALVDALLSKSPDQRPANAKAAIALVDAAVASLTKDATIAAMPKDVPQPRPQIVVRAPTSTESSTQSATESEPSPIVKALVNAMHVTKRVSMRVAEDVVVWLADRTHLPRPRVRKIALGTTIGVGLFVVLLLTCAIFRSPKEHESPSAHASSSASSTSTVAVTSSPPPTSFQPIAPATGSSGWKIKSNFH
jgi:serine/threonine-protein kinase